MWQRYFISFTDLNLGEHFDLSTWETCPASSPVEWEQLTSNIKKRTVLVFCDKGENVIISLYLIHIKLTQVSDNDNPSLKSFRSGDSETSAKKLTAGMLVTEGDDANEDGDGDDGGECDGDIFDAEGWWYWIYWAG